MDSKIKFVMKSDELSYMMDLSNHFSERYEGRVDDFTRIESSLKLIFDLILPSIERNITFVVRDFKNDLSIVFIVSRNSDEDMADEYSYVDSYDKVNGKVASFKTIFGSASDFQQYPYNMVLVIDNSGNLVNENPMQHEEYDTWSLETGNKPNKKTWKWPDKWSGEHKRILEQNKVFQMNIRDNPKKYPRPAGYTF